MKNLLYYSALFLFACGQVALGQSDAKKQEVTNEVLIIDAATTKLKWKGFLSLYEKRVLKGQKILVKQGARCVLFEYKKSAIDKIRVQVAGDKNTGRSAPNQLGIWYDVESKTNKLYIGKMEVSLLQLKEQPKKPFILLCGFSPESSLSANFISLYELVSTLNIEIVIPVKESKFDPKLLEIDDKNFADPPPSF